MPFKRLSTHISQEKVCGSHYKTIPVRVGHNVTNVQRSDCAYVNNEAATAVAAPQQQTGNYLRIPKAEERHVVADNLVDVLMHDGDIDDFQLFDNAHPGNQDFDNDSNNEDAPDGIILELNKEMHESQARSSIPR
jgi:hypothetical protein